MYTPPTPTRRDATQLDSFVASARRRCVLGICLPLTSSQRLLRLAGQTVCCIFEVYRLLEATCGEIAAVVCGVFTGVLRLPFELNTFEFEQLCVWPLAHERVRAKVRSA